MQALFAKLQTLNSILRSERPRFALWSPVMLGLGIAWYFLLPAEPRAWPAQVCALLLASLAVRLRMVHTAKTFVLALFLMALGFSAAQWRTQSLSQPILHRDIVYKQISGTLADAEMKDEGMRIQLRDVTIEGLSAEETPKRIRLTLRNPAEGLNIGDTIRLHASLFPLPRPSLPGAYDFARHFYFEGLGAVGFSMSPVEIVERAPTTQWSEKINVLRHAMAGQLRANMQAPAGSVAAALIVGDMAAIPEHVNEAMRDSGLAHVLSISGLHLSLVAGLLFFSTRLLLVLIPHVQIRWPIKKIAAAVALIGAFAYLLLAGMPVPAQRSFIMVAFVLLAILADREGLSLHTLAWAAILILLWQPEALLGASFQMSFAATLAIVALYERFGTLLYRREDRWIVRIRAWLLGLLLTSLVAGLATAPFVQMHFQRATTWGLFANMLIVPLVSFWIMPAAVLSCLLMPLGALARPIYWVLEQGILTMLRAAEWVAGWPHAVQLMHAPTPWGFALIILGLLWLGLWRTQLRLLGLPMLLLGAISALLYMPPDIWVSEEGRQVAVRNASGEMMLVKGTNRAFAVEQWLRAHAQKEALPFAEEAEISCKDTICTFARNDHRIVIALDKDHATPACDAQAELVLATFFIPRGHCLWNANFLSRKNFERDGAHLIYLEAGEIRIENARSAQGHRPWVP